MWRPWFSGSWVRQMEHSILRVVSLMFSMASAYAIRLFFAPLDVADRGETVITWVVAAGFGILGYIVSRGLVHRLMQKESILAYAPICFLVELVDIACNYVLAASVVRQAWWLSAVPEGQRGVLTCITYVVLSVIPLVSLFLAVVDMDLERSKQGAPGATSGRAVQPMRARAGALAVVGGKGASSTAATGAAVRRAQYFGNRQQQAGAGNARSLLNDPEKEEVLTEVP